MIDSIHHLDEWEFLLYIMLYVIIEMARSVLQQQHMNIEIE